MIMSYCQVANCIREAKYKCNGGFRYCPYHHQFVLHHGQPAHSWQRLPRIEKEEPSLNEFLSQPLEKVASKTGDS